MTALFQSFSLGVLSGQASGRVYNHGILDSKVLYISRRNILFPHIQSSSCSRPSPLSDLSWPSSILCQDPHLVLDSSHHFQPSIIAIRMFSFAKTLSIAALVATVLPSASASPTPTLDTLDPNHVWGVDLSIPFWLCFEDNLVLSSVCKCVPYYGKIGGKRDVSEVVRSNGLEKRTVSR